MRYENKGASLASGYRYGFQGQMGTSGYGVDGWANAMVFEGACIGGLVFSSYKGTLRFQSGQSRTTRMFFDTAGNCGVNNAAPGRKLDVLDTAAAQIRVSYSATKYAEWQADTNGDLTLTLIGTKHWMADNKLSTWGGTLANPKLTIGYNGSRCNFAAADHVYYDMTAGKNYTINLPTNSGAGGNLSVVMADSASKAIIGDGGVTNFAQFAVNGSLTLHGSADLGDFEDFTVTITNSLGGAIPAYSTTYAKVKKHGKYREFWINLQGDGGVDGSGAGPLNFSLPDTEALESGTIIGSGKVWKDASTVVDVQLMVSGGTVQLMVANSNNVIVSSDQADANRSIRIYGSYQAS
jgi:hypothetical protein